MSTAVAAPIPAPLPSIEHHPSPRSYPPLAPSMTAPSADRPDASHPESGSMNQTPANRSPSDGKRSPLSYVHSKDTAFVTDDGTSSRTQGNPKVIVKKEPGSPSMQGNARHRPRKLDLNTNSSGSSTSNNSRPSAVTPLTGREGLVMHDVGLACLSPGFQTQDPAMREQIHRSISVRDQQRSIIEARLLKSAKGDGPDRSQDLSKNMGPNSKKRPPPGLSIVPPPAQQFANERVIQSAPLHQTFTGRNPSVPAVRPSERPTQTYPSNSQLQHMPAVQTAAAQNANRLPPISDVFGSETLQPMATRPSFHHSNSTPSHNGPPMPSPGFPPQTAHPGFQSGRPREYRSAEEAVHELTGGREDLQPKLVRYGGHQPPTPPSPKTDNLTPHKYHPGFPQSLLNSRRRSRIEYEGDSSPPLGAGRTGGPQTGPFGEGRDSPATQKAKKEEFLAICSRAWDLFHS